MLKTLFKTAAAATISMALAAGAQAATWTLQNVIFGSGGSLTGSFDFDAATKTYSAVSITVAGVPGQAGTVDFSGTGAGTGQPYSGLYDNPNASGSGIFFAGQQNATGVIGDAIVLISFKESLTDAGGTIELLEILFGDCANVDSAGLCNVLFGDSTFAFQSSDGTLQGSVTTNPVSAIPLPASGLLVLSALGGLVAVRRLKKA